jgi:hypothetical protein
VCSSASASRRGGAPKRRTVLMASEMDWIVDVLECYLDEVRRCSRVLCREIRISGGPRELSSWRSAGPDGSPGGRVGRGGRRRRCQRPPIGLVRHGAQRLAAPAPAANYSQPALGRIGKNATTLFGTSHSAPKSEKTSTSKPCWIASSAHTSPSVPAAVLCSPGGLSESCARYGQLLRPTQPTGRSHLAD